MSAFTAYDRQQQKLLIVQHKVIHRRNALLTRAKHIATHTTLRVQSCTDEYDYYDPVPLPPVDEDQRAARVDLDDLAIVSDWKFTRTGCDAVVSCNPFYPKNKQCRGMASYGKNGVKVVEQSAPEPAFSFRTSNGQTFDACQPACYDPAVGLHNMVGVMSRYTFGKCRVYDPMVLAFYLDPARRYVNPDTQILERQAYNVRDALIEPYGDAALLASIPADYCDQYAETYESDGTEHEIDMYKCGDHTLVWSTNWLLGDSLPRLALISYDKLFADKPEVLNHMEERHPPSHAFLASRDTWVKHVVRGKRPLPFPLRLSDLGIRRGTATEWLVWTDEFAHLTDGRNDVYGGRLVERERPISHTVHGLRDRTSVARDVVIFRSDTANGRFDFSGVKPAKVRFVRRKREDNSSGEPEYDEHSREMLKSLKMGAAEFNRVLNEDITREGGEVASTLVGLGAGLTYGISYGYLTQKLNWPTTNSMLKGAFNGLRRAPKYARSASVKTVGYWAAESASAHVVESVATRSLINRVKILGMAKALGPLALVVDLIALIGMAIDITFILLNAFGVSTPTSRRENFVSDRRLYRLAQAEIEFNRRLYGVGNIELTPYQLVVNTPYLKTNEDVEAHLTLLPIVYAARQMNSNGGILRPTSTDTDVNDFFEVDENGEVHYSANAVRLTSVQDEEHLSSTVDPFLLPDVTVEKSTHTQTSDTVSADTVPFYYYFIVLFIIVFLIGYFYPNKYWTIVVALLASILSVLVPPSVS